MKQANTVPLIAAPVVFALVSTYTVKPILEPRFLIVVVPAISIMAAVGLCRIADRRVASGAALALLAVSLLTTRSWLMSGPTEDWQGATRAMISGLQPNDDLVVAPREGRFTVAYYQREVGRNSPAPMLEPGADSPPAAGPRLWVVERAASPDVRLPALEEALHQWLARHYRLVRVQTFKNVTTGLYERLS